MGTARSSERRSKRKDFQGEGGIMGKMGALKEKGRENLREVGNERVRKLKVIREVNRNEIGKERKIKETEEGQKIEKGKVKSKPEGGE